MEITILHSIIENKPENWKGKSAIILRTLIQQCYNEEYECKVEYEEVLHSEEEIRAIVIN
ncbi:MAG: hypothetical protein ACI8Y7_000130 [Candidatus Woesearchaeota archaeon]|jgi:hypothetical protein